MMRKRSKKGDSLLWMVIASLLTTFLFHSSISRADTIPGCGASTSTSYCSGFEAEDFDFLNMAVESGHLVLQTGTQAVDPNNIVIPFEQEVSVIFLYEGAGFTKTDFGWMLASEGVGGTKHEIYYDVNDNNNNGVLDISRWSTADRYGDTNGDGVVDVRDNRVVLGNFAAGTELVFYIDSSEHYSSTGWSGSIFYTKREWNEIHGRCTGTDGISRIIKLYDTGGEGDTDCYDYYPNCSEGCREIGWMDGTCRNRLNNIFGLNFRAPQAGDPAGFNEECISEANGEHATHVIVGAPDETPYAWILGFDDTLMDHPNRTNDYDYNDLVFMIERKTGGTAQLQSSEAITPTEAEAYYTAVTFEVYDRMPCSGKTNITYFLSIDNGDNWVEITEWDVIKSSDENKTLGSDVTDWTPGSPEYTYRSRRVDFAGMGLAGRELIWKSELVSEDEACIPEIIDITITGSVATHGFFSRSSPVVLGNVMFSGNYETPALAWTEKIPRGHVNATRLYDPAVPDSTDVQALWDAGTVLNGKAPSVRTIYFPNISVSQVTDETLGTGDGTTTTFSGTLAHHPVSATTITITDQHETFHDKHTNVLEGNFGGTGSINRFTGAFEITFNSAPGDGVPIKANYYYYTSTTTLQNFNTTNVTNAMLGLDDTYIIPTGYKYDLDEDGDFDESDGDWLVNWVRGYKDGSSTKKEWLLGAIDHSIPAVASPPGKPQWYFGTAITDAERASYDTFMDTYSTRQTVLYIGSRDGMLHAFDAGKFRWGDNPDTADIEEKRGYFLWEGGSPNYGTGEELWAFIPNNLIPRFKNNLLQGDDQSYVDASPAIADVYTNGQWRTVLIVAEGNGGDTIFCLDVTNPNSPTFLWEFADPDLFRSRSSPAIALIGKILVGGTPKWAAFFVSGKTYDPNLYPSIYIIDIADGSVIQRVFLNADSNGIGGVPSGQPAILDSDGNGYIDRIYIGSDKGLMYKVNIPDDPDIPRYDITHCVINTDFVAEIGGTVPDKYRLQPIYASPAVIVDNEFTESGEINYNIKIFFGTSDSPYYDEDINFGDTGYCFYAYVDQDNKGECNESSVVLDWFYEMPAGHRIFASAFAAAGYIYFGTSTAETEDPCEGTNEGKIYGFSEEGGSPVLQEEVGDITTSPLVEDEHLYFRTPTGLQSRGSGQYNNDVNVGGLADIRIKSWREIF